MSNPMYNYPSVLASTSSAPHMAHTASYHPFPRPQPLPPLVRVDTQAIKQELHDALGENGLAYWKAVNGYLVGQLSKRELEGMVTGWLKGDKLRLHNKLLISLLHNASTPSQAPAPLPGRKRKRLPAHDPEFDIDEAVVEPKLRISQWIGMLTNRDRARLRRAMAQAQAGGKVAEDAPPPTDGEAPNGQLVAAIPEVQAYADEVEAAKRKSTYTPDISLASMSLTDQSLPSSHQIAARLGAVAAANDLRLPVDPNDVGEFLSLGLDTHLSGILHELVQLTGRERPGSESIHMPLPTRRRLSQTDLSSDPDSEEEPRRASPSLPKPDIQTLNHLFTLVPGSHPHPSPALYALQNGHTLGQTNAHIPLSPKTLSGASRPPSPTFPNGVRNGNTLGAPRRRYNPASPPDSPPRPIVPLSSHSSTGLGSGQNRSEAVARNLLESGLLKIEAPDKEDGETGKGKKKKHGLHWKYEDPALILRDIMG